MLMVGLLEDISGPQNVEEQLDKPKGPKNLWFILHISLLRLN